MELLFWLFMTPGGAAVLTVIITAGFVSFVSQIPRARKVKKPLPEPEFILELPRPRRIRPDITSN